MVFVVQGTQLIVNHSESFLIAGHRENGSFQVHDCGLQYGE